MTSLFTVGSKFGARAFLLFACCWLIPQIGLGSDLSIEEEPNKLVIAIPSPVLSLDPTSYRDRITQTVLKNIFDSLTTRDAEMNVVPQLAESWRVLDDTSWEFRLRKGVRFHNGDPFTAEDVKYTLERVIQEGSITGNTSPRKSLLAPISGIHIVDRHRLHIQTRRPWAILPLMLSLQEIVPKRLMEAVGHAGFERNPVGTGPFQFVRKEGNNDLVLSRFSDYYGGSPDNPPVQAARLQIIIFRTVPSNVEQIAMLKRGECDIISNVPPGSIPILKQNPKIEVLSCPPTRSYFCEINCSRSPFNNPKIRLALNYAVDKRALVGHLLKGYGAVLPTILLPNAFSYHPSLAPYPYRPEKAKQMLAEADFPNGYRIRIVSPVDKLGFASSVSSFLTRIGLRCSIDPIRGSRPKSYGKDAGWDLFVTSWGNSTLDPVDILVAKLGSNETENFSMYKNTEVDHLLYLAEETPDTGTRSAYYRKVQEIVHRDAPMIFGYAADEFFGLTGRVKNFVPSPSGMMNMHDVYVED
jgi:peptide/nickel transport system substrate-binding protein